MQRNGVSVDAAISDLRDDLASHPLEQSLPDHGLILAYNFAPYADASSATVAKRIRQIGRNVDVVSQDMSSIRPKDDDLSDLVSDFVDGHFQLAGEPGFASWPSIRNYVLDGYSAVKRRLLNGQYSFIYSRSMFPATHFLAALIKSRHPEVLWISEFSDPVRRDVEGKSRRGQEIPDDYVANSLKAGVNETVRALLLEDQSVFSWCEILGVAGADRVIFTNDHQRNVMLKPYVGCFPTKELLAKSLVSPHPTLSRSFYNRSRLDNSVSSFGSINIGYFGEFYPNRGVGELVRAVSSLDPAIRDKFRIHVYTSNVTAARQSLDKLPFDTSFVRVAASKRLFTFLRLASEMDALYVCDVSIGLGYSQNPYLPSKVSDYRGAGVPILASVWPGSILSKDSAVEKFLIGDVAGLQGYLARLARTDHTIAC